MTEDLTPAEVGSIVPATPTQAALFDDPMRVLALDAAELRLVGAEIARQVHPTLAEVRRLVGLVAWAMRTKVPAGEYGKWAEGYAEMVGVSVRTLGDWRAKVEKSAGVISPFSSPRERETAGQSKRLAEPAKLIPADSQEAPAPSSESHRSDPGGVSAPAPPPAAPPPARLPSLRQVAAAWVIDLVNTEEGFGAKWTPDEAAVVNARFDLEMKCWRKANGIDTPKPGPLVVRGRMVGRKPTAPFPFPGVRTVDLLDPSTRRKRSHDPTCTCLGCKPAKAAK